MQWDKNKIMPDKILMETKDACCGMKITKSYHNGLVKINPHKVGTELTEDEVIELISVLSKWLYERRANEA